MDIYRIRTPEKLLAGNTYPGRGIIVGLTPDGTRAAAAYFIMGRSENSRNRIFVERNEEVFTEPCDPSKVVDPSLIIYAAIRQRGDQLIVTNGDQTDTIYNALGQGMSLSRALERRAFEPDEPNFTPRISALLTFGRGSFRYEMSILKSADAEGSACNRFTFSYTPVPGLGHFLHTYQSDGNPLPAFQGEPERVTICDDPDSMTEQIWQSLNADNRISLYVRYVDLETGHMDNRLINKYER